MATTDPASGSGSGLPASEYLDMPGPGVPGNLYPGLPPVRRARGYRLYTEAGRFLDFCQGGGGAILGHLPTGLGRELKALVDRGLLAPAPSRRQEQLLRLVGELFPGRRFTCHASLPRALETLQPQPAAVRVLDPVVHGSAPSDGCVTLRRPFLGPPEATGGDIVFPILPGMHGTTVVLLGHRPVAAEAGGPPGEDSLRPFDVSLLYSGVLLLRRQGDRPFKPPANEISPWEIDDAASEQGLGALWERRGPYLTPRCAKSDYDEVFNMYLKNRFYIAPDYRQPSILPRHCSRGEWDAFLAVTAQLAR